MHIREKDAGSHGSLHLVSTAHGSKGLGTAQCFYLSVLDRRDPEVILVEKWGGEEHIQHDGKKYIEPKFRLSAPGGTQEEGESLKETLCREFWEETGVKVLPDQIHPESMFLRKGISHRRGSEGRFHSVLVGGLVTRQRPKLRPLHTQEIKRAAYVGLKPERLPRIVPDHIEILEKDRRGMNPAHASRLADFLELQYVESSLVFGLVVDLGLITNTVACLRHGAEEARSMKA